jgi:hypothetical protein
MDRTLIPLIHRGGLRLLLWVVALAFVVTLAMVPIAIHYSAVHNHWTALSAVAGFGALLFAVIATFVAVIAYIGSTQRPVLRFEMLVFSEAAPTVGGNTVSWRAGITLANDGAVSARFIAVRITLSRAKFYRTSSNAAEWPIALDEHIVQWDGGVDTIIHPRWNGQVPRVDLFVVPEDPTSFEAKFEVVADRARTLIETRDVPIIRN